MGLKNAVLFAGTDNTSSFGRDNLWISDGTAAGTYQIVPPTEPDNGVQPFDIATLGNKAVFEGINKIGVRFLWVTDGTPSGTVDLGVASGPAGMTTFGNKVLFQAFFQAPGTFPGSDQLWITDGTKAGTSEIPVSGASQFGLSPGHFTPFGSKALFVGQDSHNLGALWITDGTSAGTFELSPANTYPQGLFSISSVTTPSFAVLGNQVFFQGWDAGQHSALWVTDGTSQGTTEVQLPNAAPNFAIDPQGIANIGDKIIFAGLDVNNQRDLFLTDGTQGGTSEIPLPNLFFSGPPDFTLFGNKVLFVASHGPGDYNLWELDLTTSTVSKLSVANAGPSGLFWNNNGQLSPEFTVLGNEVLFKAVDANNHTGLWVTDGTSGGTFELDVPGANSHGLSPVDLNFFVLSTPPVLINVAASVGFSSTSPAVLSPGLSLTDESSATIASATVSITGGTFAGDGDVLAANTAGTSISASYDSVSETLTLSGVDTTAHYQAVLDSVTFSSTAVDPTNAGANLTRTVTWQADDATGPNHLSLPATTTVVVSPKHFAGSGDFDGDNDNNGDLLWQNVDGSVVTWDMNGAQIEGTNTLGTMPANWHALGAGHFSGGSINTDVLFHSDSGGVVMWQTSGGHVTANQFLGQIPANWHFAGIGDVNGDGKSDVLWHSDGGGVVVWEMNGANVVTDQFVGQVPSNWHFGATGDFNGDGKADVLWQSDAGGIVLWEMNGTNVQVNQFIGQVPSNWHFAATGDFNGDGKSDVIFESDAGAIVMWQMNGTQVLFNQVIGQVPPNWHVSGTADVNGDGKSDVIWMSDTGANLEWEMSGTSVIANQLIGPNGTPNSPPLNAHAATTSATDTAATPADASGPVGGVDIHALSQAALTQDPHFLV